MKECTVKEIAMKFVATRSSAHASKYNKKPFIYNLQGASLHPRIPGYWAAVFEIRAPEGDVIDGPAVVLVDDASGEAKFLE